MSTIQDFEPSMLEEKILYILLKHESKQFFIIENLEKEFFEDSGNSFIFDAAKKLFYEGKKIDETTLFYKLNKQDLINKLADVLCTFAVSPMTESYCEMLFKKHLNKLIRQAKNDSDFKKIAELKEKHPFDSIGITHISDNTDNLEADYLEQSSKAIYTLYNSLDDCIGSFRSGDYIALGGSTGMGKTTMALNLARQACIQDRNVLYFSLEMTLEQIQNRFICMNEGLSAARFRSHGFSLIEWEKYKKGIENLKQWRLSTVCDFDLTLEKMHSYMQKKKQTGLDFVIVDYLGLINGFENKTLYEKSTSVSRRLKQLAGEFNVPVLVLVQLNRDMKMRQNKRPQLSDIRESGAIEQDADYVIFAYRDGYYNPDSPQNKLELIVSKNRHGESGRIITLDFDLKTQLIKEF